MKKTLIVLFVIMMLLYAGFLRFFDLGWNSLWIDEGFSSFVSYISFMNHLVPWLPSGRYEFSQYLFTFFQSLSYFFFGYSDFASRFPSFVFGIFQIFLAGGFSYFFLKQSKYAVWGMVLTFFLMSFSTWQVVWSREARFYELLSFLVLGGVFWWYQFLQTGKKWFGILFYAWSVIGLLFHPFYAAVFLMAVITFALQGGEKFLVEKKIQSFFPLLCSLLPLVIVSGILLIKNYLVSQHLVFGQIIPDSVSAGAVYQKMYLKYYLQNIWQHLGVFSFFGFFSIALLAIERKYKEALFFFGLIFGTLFVVSQMGFVAHSRYLFHIYSIFIILGVYAIVSLFEILQTKNKLFTGIYIVLIFISTYTTFEFTFLPQKTYYIDETSPKPNYKGAFEAIATDKDAKIVSSFPQICYLYNLKNPEVCSYALNINLTGSPETLAQIQSQTEHNYTKTTFLKYISKIRIQDYYFVLDDLAFKNAVDTGVVNYVRDNCKIVYSDAGNGQAENFVGVRKCDK